MKRNGETGLNTETVIRYLTMAVVVVTSLPVHELAHGLTANWLGDHTAKDQGRLTLNPFAHLVYLELLALLLFGFGWAKPFRSIRAVLKNRSAIWR